jgi:hypothetical protein
VEILKVENLKSLTAKLVSWFSESSVESKFQQFATSLNQALASNQRTTPSAVPKDALLDALGTFDELELSYSERRLLNSLGYAKFIGKAAIDEISNVLYDENFDPSGVNTKISQLLNEFNAFTKDVKTLQGAMTKLPDLEQFELEEGEELLEITFLDGASIDNVVDFQKWIDNWTMVIRNFSMLYGEAPESARVVFVQKSSPMILDIAAVTGIVMAIGKAAEYVLSRIEQYLRIQKQVEEIKKLKLENNEIESGLAKEAEKYAERSAEEITDKIVADVNVDIDGEVRNNLQLGINNLFVFIDQGGRVDCPTADEDEDPELHQMFLDIRQHQINVDQIRLEGPSPTEPPEDAE